MLFETRCVWVYTCMFWPAWLRFDFFFSIVNCGLTDNIIHQLSTAPGEKSESESYSVTSDSLRSHGLFLARILCPLNSPGKNTGVGCHSLLQGIFQTHGSNPDLPNFRQFFTIWECHRYLALLKWQRGKELPGSFQLLVTGTLAHFWVLL